MKKGEKRRESLDFPSEEVFLFSPICIFFFPYLENLTHYSRDRQSCSIIGLREMGFSRESEGKKKLGRERRGENLRVGGAEVGIEQRP